MYYSEGHTFVIYLDEEETNHFFEPFDPTDLPSHLISIGHRFIKQDIYDWFIENVGEVAINWGHYGSNRTKVFQFEDKNKAMLFKLTFQGG